MLGCARVLWLCAVPSPAAETATSPLKRGEVTGGRDGNVFGLRLVWGYVAEDALAFAVDL